MNKGPPIPAAVDQQRGGFAIRISTVPRFTAVLSDLAGRKANVVVTDIEASNGILHQIDAVVLPAKP